VRAVAIVLSLLAGSSPVFASHAKHPRQPQAQALSPSADVDPAELDLYQKIETQYKASFYFSLAELAKQAGQPLDAAELLQKASDADPQSALLMREQGQAWEDAGKPAVAAEVLQKALDEDPQALELRQHVARLYLQSGRKALAQSLFLNADGSDPQDPAWLRSLIGIDVAADDLPSAEKRLRNLLATPAGGADERELLALTLQREEHWADAAEQFRLLLKQDKTRAASWARLAACEDAQGDSLGAQQVLDQGLAALPDNPLLQALQAQTDYLQGRYPAAEKIYTHLLAADPKDTQSLLYRGLSRLKQGHYSEAQEDFKALGVLDKDDPNQYYGSGLALLGQGKQAEAEKAFFQVLDLNPKAVPAYTQLAFLYDKQGYTGKAVDILKRGIEAAPESVELALLLGAGYQDEKKFSDAESVYLKAMERGLDKSSFRFQLAMLYDKWDKFPQAESTLKSLLIDEPKNGQVLNYLGYSWVERGGDLKAAEGLIRRALDQEPGNAYYQDSLGWDLYKQGRIKEAAEQLQAASEKILKTADGDDSDADQAVVFDHLGEVRRALGQADAAKQAQAAAASMRKRAHEKETADPTKEPDL
jgi:tetratricopeptide (TPR) repeat protein